MLALANENEYNYKMNKKLCYLCGNAAETVDHVPPKSFFPKPWPANLLTIPCCGVSNNRLSQLDEKCGCFWLPRRMPAIPPDKSAFRKYSVEM